MNEIISYQQSTRVSIKSIRSMCTSCADDVDNFVDNRGATATGVTHHMTRAFISLIMIAEEDVVGSTSEGDEHFCRICLDKGERKDFIAPCACRGTSRWVHRACLDKWRSVKEDTAFSRCTECLSDYEFVVVAHRGAWRRRCRFYSLVLRDLALVSALLAVAVAAFSALIFLLDASFHKYLLHVARMERHELLFYAALGVAVICAYVGLHFSCVSMRLCSTDSDDAHIARCDGCCHDAVIVPYYITPDLQPSCCCLECGECCAGESCVASEGSASSCACCECCGAELGQELVFVALALFAVLALLGLVVCVFLGALVLQSIVSKHLHVLGKLVLTDEYVVKDLAPNVDIESVERMDDSRLSSMQIESAVNETANTPSFYQTFASTTAQWTARFNISNPRAGYSAVDEHS